MLGIREPNIYGNNTLESINNNLLQIAYNNSVNLDFLQSNSESELINRIHNAINFTDFIIINPAGFTHTSITIRDALLAVKIPFIEVHLSNIFAREEFRHKSYFSDIAIAVISGFKQYGYDCALNYAINYLMNKE